MQSVSTQFTNRANGRMRPLSWRALMSFPRAYNEDVEFFTIGVSLIGGADIIKGEGDVIQEWDKYQYDDYTHRVMSIEVTRQEEAVSSVSHAIADLKLNNIDNYFTPHGGSVIEDFILPYRPAKLYLGFGQENVQVFTGLTSKMPTVDEKSKTATFNLIDFMYSLYNRPLDRTIMLENVRTDEALEELMDAAGILPTQYDFDIGFNIIKFFYVPKGSKFGEVSGDLMEAEMGRLYMNEVGVIRFKNRQNFSSTPVMNLDKSNVLDIKTNTQDEIINVVEIKSAIREVQAKQKYWELQSAFVIPPNGSIDLWADFDDPVTSVDIPAYVTSATTSLFTTNTQEDGEGTPVSSDVGISATRFATSYLMTFTNTNAFSVYVTTLELWATPAKVVKEIYLREEDAVSVNQYDERVLSIDNNFFSNESDAFSKARILLDDHATYGDINELTIKGNPALQLGDAISSSIGGFSGTYVVTKIIDKFMGNKFTQILRVKKREFKTYFTIGVSLIGGEDVIAP